MKKLSARRIRNNIAALLLSAVAIPAMASGSDDVSYSEPGLPATAESFFEREMVLEYWMVQPFSQETASEKLNMEVFKEVPMDLVEKELVLENWMTVPFEIHGMEDSPVKNDVSGENSMCAPAP